jgi:archaellum biogenesis ATPase FlaH
MALIEIRFKSNHDVFMKGESAWVSKKDADEFVKKDIAVLINENLFSADELISTIFPPQKFFIDKLIPEMSQVMLYGAPETSKSLLSLLMGICIAAGIPFLGNIQTQQGTVLIIDSENGKRRIKTRAEKIILGLKDLGFDMPETLDLHFAVNIDAKLNLDASIKANANKWKYKKIDTLVKNIRPDVVIVDSITRFMDGSENDVENVRGIHEHFAHLIDKYKCAFISLHHKGKGDKERGSSDFRAQLDCMYELNAVDKPNNIFSFRKEKHRDGLRIDEFNYEIVDALDDTAIQFIPSNATKVNIEEKAITDVSDWIKKSSSKTFSLKDIDVNFKLSPTTRGRVLKAIKSDGLITLSKKKGEYDIVKENK